MDAVVSMATMTSMGAPLESGSVQSSKFCAAAVVPDSATAAAVTREVKVFSRCMGSDYNNEGPNSRTLPGDNKLTALPASFTNLSALVELDLSYNYLRSLPSDLSGLSSLKRVDFYSFL